jgi:hypothetical protein
VLLVTDNFLGFTMSLAAGASKYKRVAYAGSHKKNARRLGGIGQTALGGEIDDGVNHRTTYLAFAVPTMTNQ